MRCFSKRWRWKHSLPLLSPSACLSSCLAKYRWAQPLPPPFHYSDTLTHYLFHTLFLPPVLSHLSPLFSPGTSMCFSLIEMHFNVVQISFLQLQSKLATWLGVCVRARSVTRAYAIHTSVCTNVRAFEAKREGKKTAKKHSHSWKCYFCWFAQAALRCLPLPQTDSFSME